MSRPAPETDVAAINRLREQFAALNNAQDVAAAAACFTENAVILPPNQPSVSGRESIREWATKTFFEAFRLQVSLNSEEVSLAGDLGVDRGSYSLTLTPKAGGAAIQDTGKYILILERQFDGSWKITRDIWNSNNPATAQSHDPVVIDAKRYKVEFENERVRVVRASYGPREKSVMHAHPALVGVLLTDGHFRFTLPDGKTEEIQLNAGQALFFDAQTHLPENLSDKPFEAILVELKT